MDCLKEIFSLEKKLMDIVLSIWMIFVFEVKSLKKKKKILIHNKR